MPILEASPDEKQALRSKLVTLPKNTARIPIVTIGQSSVTLQAPGDIHGITPNTSNFEGGNATFGYTAILSDSTLASISVTAGQEVNLSSAPTIPQFISDAGASRSIAVIGKEFRISSKTNVLSDSTATITFIGNETGGSATINLTIKKQIL